MARDYVERGRGNKGKRPGAGKGGRKRAPAKRGSSGRASSRKPAPRQGMPGWLWMLVGLSIGIVGAVVLYVLMGPSPGTPDPADAPPPAQQAPAADSGQARAADTPTIPPKQDARFTFYELLPNLSLVPRSDTYVPGAQSKKNVDYVIQAGSFADRDDADTRRAQLILLGMEPRINKAQLGAGRTTYRVEVGPDSDYDRVKERMARLIAEDIDVFFREVPKATD